MTKEELRNLIDDGHEIEFEAEGKRYSITYGIVKGEEVISFCEFYKETTEVKTVDELCQIKRDGHTVLELLANLTENDILIY